MRVMVITHDLRIMKAAGGVVVLDKGTSAEEGDSRSRGGLGGASMR